MMRADLCGVVLLVALVLACASGRSVPIVDDVPVANRGHGFDPGEPAAVRAVLGQIVGGPELPWRHEQVAWRELWQGVGWRSSQRFPASADAAVFFEVLAEQWAATEDPRQRRQLAAVLVGVLGHERFLHGFRVPPMDRAVVALLEVERYITAERLGRWLREIALAWPDATPVVLGVVAQHSEFLLADPLTALWVRNRYSRDFERHAAEFGALVLAAPELFEQPQLVAQNWQALLAAWESAHAAELSGDMDERVTRWRSAFAENSRQRFRSRILRRIQRSGSPFATEALSHIVAKETVAALQVRAAKTLKARPLAHPATVHALVHALRSEHGEVRRMALERLANLEVAQHPEVLRELHGVANDPLQPLRRKARRMLEQAGIDPPRAVPVEAPQRLISELAKLIEVAWVEPEGMNTPPVPPGQVVASLFFRPDKQDESGEDSIRRRFENVFENTITGLVVFQTSVEHGPAGVPAVLADAGYWIVDDEVSWEPRGWDERHDDVAALRLAFACRMLDAGRSDYESRVHSRYAMELSRRRSDREIVDALVYDLAWKHYDMMLHLFAQFTWDAYAKWHAERLLALEGYARPSTDLAIWVEDARRLLRDLQWRETAPTFDLQAIDSLTDPAARAEQLVAHLHEASVEQISQPGAALPFFCPICLELKVLGTAAIAPLLDVLDESERLVRGYGFPRIHHRTRYLVTIGEVARYLLPRVLSNEYGARPPSFLLHPLHRDQLREWIDRREAERH